MVTRFGWSQGFNAIETFIKVNKSIDEDGDVQSIYTHVGQLGFLTRHVSYDKREYRVFGQEIYPGSSDNTNVWLPDDPIDWLDFLRDGRTRRGR